MSTINQIMDAQADLQMALGLLRLKQEQIEGVLPYGLDDVENRLARSLALLHKLLSDLGRPMAHRALHPDVEMKIECQITRYTTGGPGHVYETTSAEHTTARVIDSGGEFYLVLGNCAGSAPVERLRGDAWSGEIDRWVADAGAKPVYVEPCPSGPRPCGPSCGCGPGDDRGGWGGRNYPRVEVLANELKRVLG